MGHRMKWPVFFRKLHKWLGLIIGIQLLAWVLGGLFMTSIPIKTVRGEHLRAAPAAVDWQKAIHSPAAILNDFPSAKLLRLSHFQGNPAYALEQSSERFLVSAISGLRLANIDAETAKTIAMANFTGKTSAPSTLWIESEPPIEYREKPLPVWQVDMHDEESTHVYVDALTGEVTAMRTATWRVFDFFWMLHVMDYSTRDNFNNPLVITAAAFALITLISGFFMLYFVFRPKKQHH